MFRNLVCWMYDHDVWVPSLLQRLGGVSISYHTTMIYVGGEPHPCKSRSIVPTNGRLLPRFRPKEE